MHTPEMPQIVLRPIESLVAYARNARTHSPAQLEKLQASLREFGWTNPVLADAMGIVAGHGRTMAAAEMYKRGEAIRFPNGAPIPLGMVPVVDCTGWSDQQRKAYILTDNRSALDAGWDEELLRLELADLRDDGYDLSLTGFEDVELAALFEGVVDPEQNDRDPDDVPDEPVVPLSREGDVWVCGPHRVMCGSSTEIACWDKLMQGELCDAVWTDPPYNVNYESKLAGSIKNDNMKDSAFRQFLLDAYAGMFSVMKAGAPIYVAHADTEGFNFRGAFRDAGFKLSGCLIWRKNSLVLGRSDYQWMHEPILYGFKPGAAHRWYGGRKLTTIIEYGENGPIRQLEDGRWAITVGDNVLVVSGEATIEEHPGSVIYHDKPSRSELHPTCKPVTLIEKMLRASARPGDIIVDAFGGSGSTLIAADRMGMSARLMELDPKFVDVITRRYWQYTGRRPVHAVTGEPFPEEGGARADAHDHAAGAETATSGDFF